MMKNDEHSKTRDGWHLRIDMQKVKIATLVLMALFPLTTLWANDLRYNRFLDGVCRDHSFLAEACNYPERYEVEGLISTAFYRHLRTYIGGSAGTSPSLNEYVAWYAAYRYTANDSGDYRAIHEIMQQIRQFNLQLVLSMGFSIIIASSAGTLLVQQMARGYRQRRSHRS